MKPASPLAIRAIRRRLKLIPKCIILYADVRAKKTRILPIEMHWSEEQDRLSEEQVALHKRQLARQSDAELEHSYAIYLREREY